MATPHRVDTHTHILPPDYSAWLKRRNADAGGLPIPDWSVDAALEAMDGVSVRTAIVSVSTPGVHFGDDTQARDMARAVNEYCAALVRRHPDRFGFFATLTLPDVDGALAELAHAFDVLHADGVVLLANANGQYLGAPEHEPLFDELERRGAVVFVHPAQLPGSTVPGIPAYAVDFLLDTTRAAVRLLQSGTLERCPNLKIILSHAGGFVPYAAQRIALTTTSGGSVGARLAQLKRFYFDVALSASPTALPSLLAFAEPDHVLFGTDWPHAPAPAGRFFTSLYDGYAFTNAQRASIDRGAAERLFPRLAGP